MQSVQLTTQEPFTTGATSRFLNADVVLERVRMAAQQCRQAAPEVVRIHLFGSFATGRANPQSDADVLVVVERSDEACWFRRGPEYMRYFAAVPVPVDLFVLTVSEYEESLRRSQGVGALASRQGVALS